MEKWKVGFPFLFPLTIQLANTYVKYYNLIITIIKILYIFCMEVFII